MWEIKELQATDSDLFSEAARILMEALVHVPSAWQTIEAATEEVHTFITDEERFALLALEDGQLRGWIGGIRHSQFQWELHPLVVDPAHQRRRWGRRLVNALEERAKAEKVLTIWLGTDDDYGGTNLFGRDLYPDVLRHLQSLKPTQGGHAFTFYRRMGYAVTGVLPDVDGLGKHDIIMAKRIGGPDTNS